MRDEELVSAYRERWNLRFRDEGGLLAVFFLMRGLADVYQLTPVLGNRAVGRELFILIRLSESVFRLTFDFPRIICTSSLLLWIILPFLVWEVGLTSSWSTATSSPDFIM